MHTHMHMHDIYMKYGQMKSLWCLMDWTNDKQYNRADKSVDDGFKALEVVLEITIINNGFQQELGKEQVYTCTSK